MNHSKPRMLANYLHFLFNETCLQQKYNLMKNLATSYVKHNGIMGMMYRL